MEPSKLKIGDVVWIYEASVHQCSQGIIAGLPKNDRLYAVDVPYYAESGKLTMDQHLRGANEIFPTAAAAIDSIVKQFFDELRRNTYSWQEDQEKRKAKHAAERTADR